MTGLFAIRAKCSIFENCVWSLADKLIKAGQNIDFGICLICDCGQTLGLWYDGGSDGPRADDSVFIECQYVCQ